MEGHFVGEVVGRNLTEDNSSSSKDSWQVDYMCY